MKTTIAMLTASMATAILAHPFDARSQQCNIAPSATASTKIQPLSTPTASTARVCQKLCTEHSSCKSFLFGLPADAKAPTCKLYGVPAAQVPKQGNNLHVFDKACSDKAVPNTKPTQDKPRGEVKINVARDMKPDGKPRGGDGPKGPQPPQSPQPPHNRRDMKPDDKPHGGDGPKGPQPPQSPQPPHNRRDMKPDDKPHGGDGPKGPQPPQPPQPPHNRRDMKPDGKPRGGDGPKGPQPPQHPHNQRDIKPDDKPHVKDQGHAGGKAPKNKGPQNPPHNKRGIKHEDKPKATHPHKDKNGGNDGHKHN